MFDIGFWELLVIGVMALVILGPARLPGAIRSTLSTVRSVKQAATGFKNEMETQLRIHELHENLRKAEEQGLKDLDPDLQASVDELKRAAESVTTPYKNDKNTDFTSSIKPNSQQNSQQNTPQDKSVSSNVSKVASNAPSSVSSSPKPTDTDHDTKQ